MHSMRIGCLVRTHLKTPKLDEFIRQVVVPASKNADKELVKILTFVLDAVAPLAMILEAGNSEDKELSIEEVVAATTSAVELIGNANTRISRLRHEKVCSHLNKTLQPLVQRDEIFKKAAPALFGAEFAKMSKEHTEQVKAIQAVIHARKTSFF